MRALFGSVVLGAMLAQTASVWADGATAAEIPVPWGSSSRGPFGGPSWRPGHEHNVPAPRTGDDKIPLEASGLDGRRDSAAAIQQLILMVEQHALTDGGRGYGASAVAAALDRIALGTAVEDISARLRLALPEDRPYRAVLLATLSQLYGRAGSYRYELWSLCDALLTAPPQGALAGWLRSRVRSLAGDDAKAHRTLVLDGQRLRAKGVAAKTR